MGVIDRMLRNGISQDDLEIARESGRQEGYAEGYKKSARACYAAAVMLLKRDYGFDRDKIVDFLKDMDLFATSMMARPEQEAEILDEAGVEVRIGQGLEQVALKTARPVLCDKCLFGDPVSARTWDCDMLDGITSGKTECKHYKDK